MAVILGRIYRPDPKGEAVRDRVKATVTEGIAAQQPPGSEKQAPGGTEATNRLRRVGGAARLVAAAAGQRG
jgi:hypothetical protein